MNCINHRFSFLVLKSKNESVFSLFRQTTKCYLCTKFPECLFKNPLFLKEHVIFRLLKWSGETIFLTRSSGTIRLMLSLLLTSLPGPQSSLRPGDTGCRLFSISRTGSRTLLQRILNPEYYKKQSEEAYGQLRKET